jgi:hypothetical protein
MERVLLIINIVSLQAARHRVTGPKKVFTSVISGLDFLGVKYVLNQPIRKYKYNWIHDDQRGIIEAGFSKKPVLVGPNTAVLPKDLPLLRKAMPQGSIYLHPSQWSVDIWHYLKYTETKLDSWPAGIDINKFQIPDRVQATKVLLYFKQRDENLLTLAKCVLAELGLEYILIKYGFYTESEYKESLKNSKFGIWIGCSESQGIALQEALATGLPLIVLDATSIFDTIPIDSKKYFPYKFPESLRSIKTSTAPYFDERCGIKIENIEELKGAIDKVLENFQQYSPREYVKEYLTLEMSAKKIILFFEKMNIKDTVNSDFNYQKISSFLFYASLIFQKKAWTRAWKASLFYFLQNKK